MTKTEKTALIEELREKFAQNQTFYLCDASGMSVADTNAFRRQCFNAGLEYRVYKNTLIRKALESTPGDFTALNDRALTGFSGVIFSKESGKAPATLLTSFHKTGKDKPVFKAAAVDTALFIGAEQLDALTKLKSRQELIGDIVGLLQSPMQNLVSALTGQGSKIAAILQTLEERGQGSAEAA